MTYNITTISPKGYRHIKRLLAVCLILIGGAGMANADRTVTGLVQDSEGEPLIGATVLLSGTTNGTATDYDGNFSLNVPETGTLVVRYVGYDEAKVKLTSESHYIVTLKDNSQELNEVVVLGYNTVSKKSFTGSASTVTSDEINAMKTVSPTEALQGRAAGVSVATAAGVPGAPTTIRVRGVNSISSGKDPLWIIDGVPMYSGSGLEASNSTTGQDPMSMINPNDIESMEILKDAAATAIYGSRGSNGVIIITTKSGKAKQNGSVTIEVNTGISHLSRTPQDIGFADTEQWFRIADLAYQYQMGDPDVFFEPSMALTSAAVPYSPISRDEAMATNSDWFDQALRTGHYVDVNLGMVKGFDKGSVYTSFNFRRDDGVIKNNDFTKFSGRVNTNYEVIRNLDVGANMSFSYSKNNRVKNGASAIGAGGGTAGAFQSANRTALPWMPIYDENDPTGYWSARSGNIAANNDRNFLRDYVDQYRVVGNMFAQFNFAVLPGFALRTELGIDYISNSSVDWRHALLNKTERSYAFDQNANRFVLNWNGFAKYNNGFGNNKISAVAGVESMQMNSWRRRMEGEGLIGIFPEMGNANPAEMKVMQSFLNGEEYLLSFFLRADYRFMDRYVAALSLRTDGSSKFEKKKRWGKFLAISAGWLISEEKFFEPARTVMNLFKFKLSFGQTGNNSVPNNIYETVWASSGTYRYGDMDDIANGLYLASIANKSATWETTTNYDTGIDYGFLNNRISGSLDFYYKDISDMLLKASLPVSAGITGGNSIWANVGSMANYGIDFSIKSINIDANDFVWNTTFNISWNHNKIKHLTPDLDKGGKGIADGLTRHVNGHSYGTWFMPYYAGIDPERGVEMIWEIDRDLYEATGRTELTGNKIPATTENMERNNYLFDGKTSLPSWYGGLNNTFSYKGFDLTIFFTFSGGNYIYDFNLKRASYFHNGQSVILADLNEANIWSPENPNAKYPAQSWNSNYPGAGWNSETNTWDENTSGNYNATYNHSKFLFKGDFLRLKNLTLGYTLPAKITRKAYMQQVRFYLQATNLFTATKYPGYDPEGASYVYNPSIPNLRTYSIGVTVKF